MNQAPRTTSDVTRRGNLASTPLADVLMALLDAQKTGTLRILRADGICDTVVRVEDGVPVGARLPSVGLTLAQTLIPLFTRSTGAYVFVEGQDDVGTGAGASRGRVDPVALIAAASRGPLREDAVAAALMPLKAAALHLLPRVEAARYGFTAQEQAVVAALASAPRTMSELSAMPDLGEHTVRRVIYVLAVTRALVPTHGVRHMVSGTMERVTPPAPVSSASMAGADAAALGLEPSTAKLRAPDAGGYSVRNPAMGETHVAVSGGAGRTRVGADKAARTAQADLHRREAERLLRRMDYTAAAQQAQKAMQLDGTAASEALFAYMLQLTCGDAARMHPRVLHHLDRALQREPSSVEASYYKGLVLRRGGQPDDAARYFRRVLRIAPSHADAARELRLLETRQSSQANLVSKILNRFPSTRPKR